MLKWKACSYAMLNDSQLEKPSDVVLSVVTSETGVVIQVALYPDMEIQWLVKCMAQTSPWCSTISKILFSHGI